MNETKTEQRSGKGLLIAQISVVLILVLVIAAYFALIADVQKEYAIFDGDQVTRLNSDSTNIEEVLAEAGIAIGENDIVSLVSEGSVTEILIQRQNTVTVTLGDKIMEKAIYGTTVSEALQELDITLSEQDSMVSQGESLSPGDKVYDGMDICITQNSEKTVTESKAIPYDTITFLDPTLAEGVTKVKTPGVAGKQEVTTLERYVNGVLVSSTAMGTRLVANPVTEVILIGSGEMLSGETEAAVVAAPAEEAPADEAEEAPETEDSESEETASEDEEPEYEEPEYEEPEYEEPEYEEPEYEEPEYEEPEYEEPEYEEPEYSEPSISGNYITTSSGDVLYYSESFTVEATAYTGGGTTATGTPARYGAIAVDPDVIPYGTRMYIVSNDGYWIYGEATAEDCGGAINGYIIDLYFDSYDTCIQFGRRDCTVYILD
ncbi:MAG: G5 domain-containing protein [Oscillospiraceae bacterium]|nr:G5 domain-containing protein [Oscillospiraceae bacterium]